MRHVIKIFSLLSIIFFSSVLYSAGDTNKLTLAVMDFRNLSKNKGYDFLEKTISESLITSFERSKHFNIVERQQISALIDEKKLILSGLAEDDAQGKQIGVLLKADNLVLGSFSTIEGKIEINARLVNIDTGEVLMTEKVVEEMGDKLFARIDELAESMIIRLSDSKFGFLNLDTTPQGAQVKLENSIIGTTPVSSKKMRTGSYSVTIVKDGFEIKTVGFEIQDNKTKDIDISLTKKIGELFRNHISIYSHFIQFLSPDYQFDWGAVFETYLSDFSIGLDMGGHNLYHNYEDKTAPGIPYKDNMTLVFLRLAGVLKYNFFKDSQYISPYIGAGAGVDYLNANEYGLTNTSFYYKGIAGITLFPAGRWSIYVELIYNDLGYIEMHEKKFNLFGNYTFTKFNYPLNNLMLGAGIRLGF